ncbi:MAG: ATP-binding protein [Desulfosarcinaceae bacterium]
MQNEELRGTQRALERSRDRYLELYHNAPVGYVVTDSAGIILQANKTFGHMLDLEIAGIHHQPLSRMIYAQDQELFYSKFRAFYNNPSDKHLEIRMVRTNGDIVVTSLEGRRTAWSGSPASDDEPSHQLLITIRDITRQKATEQAIVRAKTQWEQTFDAVPELIAIIDGKSKIVRVNKALASRLGKSPQECVGKKCYEVLHRTRRRPADCPHQRFLASGRPIKIEAFSRRLNGYFITSVSPLNSGDQLQARWCIHISHDVTERKRAEGELVKLRNLESLGYLAGGLAHDFNNILSAQAGNIELAKLHFQDNAKASAYLDSALKATETAKELAGRLLTFAKGGSPFRRPVILDRLVEETLQEALDGTNVTCDLQLSGSLEPMTVDESQLRSALRNIIGNAREAMPDGGILQVTATELDVLPGNEHHIAPGRYIKLEICDQGAGISAEVLEKVFDPYFTTKPMGAIKGTGLGLTISHSIIRKHHGHIAIRSAEGQGTTVIVHLPLKLQPTAADTSAPVSAHGNRKSRPRFLVMDDEKSIWDIVGAVFEQINCDVDFASDGEEAVRLYERSLSNGNAYAGLLLDMTIPGGIGATETIKKIHAKNPDAKAAVFSGYSADPIFEDFKTYGFVATLKKPFKIDELKTLASQLLAQSGNPAQPIEQTQGLA